MRLADFMGPLLALIARMITGAQGHWKGCPPSNEQRILVEGPARKPGLAGPQSMGRTVCNRIVNFPSGPEHLRLVGQMIDVRITEALPHSLRGEVLTRA